MSFLDKVKKVKFAGDVVSGRAKEKLKNKIKWKIFLFFAPVIGIAIIVTCLYNIIFEAIGYSKAQEIAIQMIYMENQTIQEKLEEYESIIKPTINNIFENGITTGQNIRIPLDPSEGGNAAADATGSLSIVNLGSKELPGAGAVYDAYQQVWQDFCRRRDESNGKYGEFAFEYNEITETFWENPDWKEKLATIVQCYFPEQEIRDIYAPIGSIDGTPKNPSEILKRNFELFITGSNWGYIVGGGPVEKTVEVSEEEKREFYRINSMCTRELPPVKSETFTLTPTKGEYEVDKNKKYYVDELEILGGSEDDSEMVKAQRKSDWLRYFAETKQGLASYGSFNCFEKDYEMVDKSSSEAILSYTVDFNAETETSWTKLIKELENREFKKITSDEELEMAIEMIRYLANVNDPSVDLEAPAVTMDGTMFMMPTKEQFDSIAKVFNTKFSWRDYTVQEESDTRLELKDSAGLVTMYSTLTEQMGFTKEAACAVLGVAKTSTNFNCEFTSSGGGYGIFDWRGDVLNKLKLNTDYEECNTQIKFFQNDFSTNNKYYDLRQKLPSMTNMEEAAKAFKQGYMPDSICLLSSAIEYANQYYEIIDKISDLSERTQPFVHLTDDEIETYMFASNASGKAAIAVNYALNQVGQPYSQQTRNKNKRIFDCGSLCLWAYEEAGMDQSELTSGYAGYPGTAAESWRYFRDNGKTVAYEDMQAGDLIYYQDGPNGRCDNVSHVQMYIGNGICISAHGDNYGVIIIPASDKKLVGVARPTLD